MGFSFRAWRARACLRRGLLRLARDQRAEALDWFDRSLALAPDHPEALYKRAGVLVGMDRHAEALADYERLLRLQPDHGDAHYNRGVALQALHRHREAIDSYGRALAVRADDADAHNNRGLAWSALKRVDRAQHDFAQAVALRPDHAEALHNHAVALQSLRRYVEAAASYERLLALRPDYPYAAGKLLHARMLGCDWRDLDRWVAEIDAGVARGDRVIDPFAYLAVAGSGLLARRCAETYATELRCPPMPAVPPTSPKDGPGRIRVGYVSGEFRQQATSLLMVRFFELRDRARFDGVAFDNGFDDGSAMRRRLGAAFDEFVDIAGMSDVEAAAAVRRRGIDILVDLSGYFGFSRPGVFALRPAPVQVNYLGFPGTLGSPWMDYILADRQLIPAAQYPHFTERVVELPGCYQPNDDSRTVADGPARADCGLPSSGFVFCCFNNNFKITPAVYDVWMRLLAQVQDSVLWLLEDNATAAANLRAEAGRRGVDPGRVIFAPRWPHERHLARHRLADLFLDTTPCNAHTTASDALWAGLPVLTCSGETFASRVAGSLLHGLELPELVTADLAAYEAMALRLAQEPATLAAVRQRLDRHRLDHPPFDTAELTRHVEAAYSAMHARWARGESPAAFAVGPVLRTTA